MHHALIPYKQSLISCYRFGDGPEPVVCFHGYGETAVSFSFLGEEAGDRFTFYAVELPFHGDTQWNGELTFEVGDLLAILSLIDLPAAEKPALLGFSLGGRMVLALYQQRPLAFRKLVLLAPDGLVMNPWYWLATQTSAGNRLFRFTMEHPSWFFSLLKGLNRAGRVNASVFKFVNASIGNEASRLVLYRRWTILRKVKPDLQKIKRMINKNQTPVQLIYGKYDRIILPSRGQRFCKGIDDHCQIMILPAGHQLLQRKYAEAITAALK